MTLLADAAAPRTPVERMADPLVMDPPRRAMPGSGYTYLCEFDALKEGRPATRPVPVYPVRIEDGRVEARVVPRSDR